MSIFSWIKPKSASGQAQKLKGLRADPDSTVKEQSKSRRQEQREQLYHVVREAMLRAEVLAASYKFKVLSLDGEGRQYLIMIDLLKNAALPPERWLQLEQLMMRNAAAHHRLQVKAVYWRPGDASSTAQARPPSHPVPTKSAVSASRASAFEPICTQEMMAFKNAMNPAVVSEAGHTGSSGARSPVAATGFEDTELMEPDDSASPLSRTQYGDL